MNTLLTNADITKFKKLCKEKFDIDLDDHEARHKLSLLVRQMEIVYQPITEAQLQDLIIYDAGSGILNTTALQVYDDHQIKQASNQKRRKKD